jgi:hypothetical protein
MPELTPSERLGCGISHEELDKVCQLVLEALLEASKKGDPCPVGKYFP